VRLPVPVGRRGGEAEGKDGGAYGAVFAFDVD
jgi:hypothetical protein